MLSRTDYVFNFALINKPGLEAFFRVDEAGNQWVNLWDIADCDASGQDITTEEYANRYDLHLQEAQAEYQEWGWLQPQHQCATPDCPLTASETGGLCGACLLDTIDVDLFLDTQLDLVALWEGVA